MRHLSCFRASGPVTTRGVRGDATHSMPKRLDVEVRQRSWRRQPKRPADRIEHRPSECWFGKYERLAGAAVEVQRGLELLRGTGDHHDQQTRPGATQGLERARQLSSVEIVWKHDESIERRRYEENFLEMPSSRRAEPALSEV